MITKMTEEEFNDKYEKENNRIGEGGFGLVISGKIKSDDTSVAIKIIPKPTVINQNDKMGNNEVEKIRREINLLKEFDSCPFIVDVIDAVETDSKFYIVMEKCDCDLKRYLEEKKELSDQEIIDIFYTVNKGLKELHKKNILHRDLKPANILLTKKGDFVIAKLCDFGNTRKERRMEDGNLGVSTCSFTTFEYAAPEVLSGKGPFNEKLDLWSIGCILYQLHFGNVPFGSKQFELFLNQPKGLNDSTGNPLFDDLLKKLLQYDIEKRISYNDYIYHDFLFGKESKELNKFVKNFERASLLDSNI